MALEAEEGTKQRRGVEPWETQPVNAPVPGDQGPGLEIREQSIVLNGSSHGFTKAQTACPRQGLDAKWPHLKSSPNETFDLIVRSSRIRLGHVIQFISD